MSQIGGREVETIVVGVSQSCPVVLIDVPVELGEDLLIFHGQRRGKTARNIAVLVHGDIDDLLVDCRIDVGAGGTVVEQVDGFILLVGAEEEQRVLDDRAADIEAVALVFIIWVGIVTPSIESPRRSGLCSQRTGRHGTNWCPTW